MELGGYPFDFVHDKRQLRHDQNFSWRAQAHGKLTYFRMGNLYRQLNRLIDLLKDFPAVPQEHTPRGRDLYFVLAAVQKLGSNGFFELNNLLAEPRLSCTQALGGSCEIEPPPLQLRNNAGGVTPFAGC